MYGPTMSAEEAAAIWGCSSWTLYGMVRAGTAPVAPLHLGRLLRWPTAAVLASVGLKYDPGTGLARAEVDDAVVGVAANLRVLPGSGTEASG